MLQRAFTDEAHNRISKLPWWDMVRALKRHIIPIVDRDETYIHSKLRAEADEAGIGFTMGEATLEIALAHMAIKEKHAFLDVREELYSLLLDTLQVWKRWGALYKLEGVFYEELVELVGKVQFK